MRLFFGDTKFDFSIVAVRIFVALRIFLVAGFCFRLNTCTSKISNLLLLLGTEGVGAVNLDILYFSLPFLVVFVLKYNVDEKNMQNINIRIHVKVELQVTGCD